MRTIRLKVYKFAELNDEAKKVAIKNNDDINVSYNWWEYLYGDAEETAGLKIYGFELEGKSISSHLIEDVQNSINLILENHGEEAETYQLAEKFNKDWSDLVTKYSNGIQTDKVAEGNEEAFDAEADKLEEEFKYNLSNAYFTLLEKEYDYLISDEAIIETLEANDYEFTQDGERFHG